MQAHRFRRAIILVLALFIAFLIAACNLPGSDDDDLETIDVPTSEETTPEPTWTADAQDGAPTSLPIPSSIPFPTSTPRSISILPTLRPAFTPLPVSIYILSPVPGNVVSGNVQVIGSATHPQFLQYQLEYGPDPNASNLWFPITGAIQSPVTNNLLGIWNTRSGAVPDGSYQLRLRVFLRDGSEGGTVVVNNIRVQNQAPTPQPTNTQVIPRPIAAFTQNTVSGTAPLDVQFTNQSIGQNISYLWNFGDGTTSAETHPRHTYRNPGTYTVVLTASNAGGTANVSRNIAVQSANPPVASFTANPTSGTAPLTVQFSDQSSGGQITRWEWNFGDGTTSDQRNPTHTYSTGGNYNAILTVRGPGGSSFATRQINVAFEQVDPPVASFRPNQPVTRTIPFTIDFQNTTSGGQVTSYRWDFGDGSLISTETNPSHTFTVPGNFVVTLTATGPGGSSTATLNVVANAELTADFSFQTSELRAQFSSQVSGGTGSYSYAWNFGDGTTSTQANPSHNYASAGTYPVRLTVRDGTSEVAVSKQVTVDVALPELIADFNATTDDLTVQFTAAPTGGTGNYSYAWNFGDGTTSTQANPSHTYGSGGTYPVRLVVNDGVSEDAVTKEVAVEVPLPELVADFNATPDGLTAQFAAAPSGGTGNYSYVWNFGDGVQTSTQPNPQITYASAGTYSVTLVVNDGVSEDAVTKEVTVEAPLPELVADFNATPDGLTVQFAAAPTGGTGNYSYVWDFGDGVQTSIEANPQITYASAGTYPVTLVVNDGVSEGAVTKEVTVEAPLPELVADFNATPDGLTVQFAAAPTGGTGNYSYVWDFGDGTTSNEANPSHAYANAGTYPVTLVVNDGVSENAVTKEVTVEAPLPELVADFNATPDGLTVQFAAAPTGGTGNYSYVWDFGDGVQTSIEANPQITYASAGTYPVTLVVNDGVSEDAVTKEVTVEAPLPELVADFNATPDGLTVQFAAAPTGGTGNYSYVWDFGDGTTSNEANPSHAYANAGTYPVTLVVNDGVSENAVTKEVTVEAPLPELVADFNATPDGLTVQFAAAPTGGTGNYSYVWDFGDGTTSNEANPSHAYANAGTYPVTLVVNDGVSEDAVTKEVTVEAPLPELVADFNATPDGLTVQFAAAPTGGTGNYSYVWDFGDGTTSNEANPSHAYANAGTYPVTLVVNDGVSEDAVTKEVTVEAPLPELVADFNATPDGLTVQFAAAPTGGTGNYSYVWDFGDGTTSNEPNPSHAYANAGTYPVTLVVNDGVSENAVTKEVTVEAAVPESPVLTTPIMPDLALIETAVRGMFNDAMSAGRNGRAFVVIGDETAESSRFFDPLATPGTDYTAPDADFLDNLIAAYNTADLGLGAGINSFNRESVATGSLTAQELLEETEPCNGGAVMTRVECEIQTVNPAFAYISVGYNDIQNNTDPDAFQTHMEDLIQLVLDQNVVPIVLTTYPTPNMEQQGLAINEAIIAAADVQQVPLVNIWRAFDELPDDGLDGAGNPTVDPQGEGYISLSTTAGANLRNTLALRILYQIGQLIQ